MGLELLRQTSALKTMQTATVNTAHHRGLPGGGVEEATASAQRIRRDLQELRGRYGTVEPQDKCATCDFPLLNRPFYLFLCGHMFHADCLLQAVRPGLPAYKQARLEELQRKLGAAPPPASFYNCCWHSPDSSLFGEQDASVLEPCLESGLLCRNPRP